MALVLRVGRIFFRNPATPQNVVGNEESAFAQARCYQPQHARIIFFVHIVEDDVEFLLLLGEEFQSVAGMKRDAVGNSGPIEIAAGALGVFADRRRCR